ncbi:MAG: hypothetical protein GVY23_07015 [Spirochaetes bacterium]|jgi:HPt (histidine-containing phosphotransfer) domain-containing protein|nr:hypothetical protein [Spirochaetota bacterium]
MGEKDAAKTPPFDLAVLEAQYADAPEILEEIFSIFLEETPQRMEMLSTGLAEDDTAVVTRAAHSLANTSGTLRAQRALALARATESAARDGDLEAMQNRAESLMSEVKQVLDQIRARESE